LAVWLLFGLSWAALHGLIVPRLEQWRPRLETVASRALGVQVQVESLQATDAGLIPAVELRGVRLLDQEGREALHLPLVRAALSVRSLWRLGFEQLVVQSPVLSVRRTGSGQIEVGGVVLSRQGEDGGRMLDWLLSQPELALLDGELHWRDDLRPEAPALALRQVQAVLRRNGRQHEFRFDASPPAPWGERFSVRGRWNEPFWSRRPGDWRAWTGSLYADLPWADLAQLQRHVDWPDDWGLDLAQGRGRMHLWADLRSGRLSDFQADLALPEVEVRWAGRGAAAVPPFLLRDLAVRLQGEQRAGVSRLSTQHLAFRTAEGLAWPGGDLRLEQRERSDGSVQAWTLQADRVGLGPLQRLGRRLPLPATWREWLDTTQPEGVAEALSLSWGAGSTVSAPTWSARGRLHALEWRAGQARPALQEGKPPRPGRPGVRGLDLVFDLTETGGTAELQLQQGALVFPGLFESPELLLDGLEGKLRWQRQGSQWMVELNSLHFANADTAGVGRLRWQTSEPATHTTQGTDLGVLDLDIRLERAEAAQVHRYLPLAIPERVRHYLREAIRAGRAHDAHFVVQGPLEAFPYANPDLGRFEVRAQLEAVDFQYVPTDLPTSEARSWPALDQVQAQLRIDRTRLQLNTASARVRDLPVLQARQVEASIDDLKSTDPLLTVRGQVQGPGEAALAFIHQSPLDRLLSGALTQAQLRGPVEIGLALDVPLKRVRDIQVKGQWRLAGNDLRVLPESPWLMATSGRLDFTERGFQLPQASARLLGGELRFSGGMERQGQRPVLRFQGQGKVTAEGLRRAADMGGPWSAVSAVGARASGGTSYQARLEVLPEGTNLRIQSGLQGLALALPPPLQKPAEASWPLRLEQAVAETTTERTEARRDRLELDWRNASGATVLAARLERTHSPDGVRVPRGAMSLGTALAALPGSGVRAQLVLGDTDLTDWQRWADAWPATVMSGGAGPALTDSTRAYWPTEVALSATRLVHEGRAFHDVVAGGTRAADVWRMNLRARELEGYVEYRARDSIQPGKVYARLARLNLPPSSASEVERLLQSPQTSVPALDIVVDELELRGRQWGRLEVVAVNEAAGTSRPGQTPARWRLSTLNLGVPEARLQATGQWLPAPPGARSAVGQTELDVQLTVKDAGALLSRFGMDGVLRAGRGSLGGRLGWAGSPLSLDLPSLNGELQLDLQRGQFLRADPGLAKLLGVLNLQALPRRLTLDFRDVFSQGFAFDFVRGQTRIAQGVASTNNLQMKGVSAAVLLEGQADTVRETQDLNVVVVPELNAGTASLIATAINPVTGLGAFLAQFLLRQPLQEAATQQFRITGSWLDPQVEKVNRRTIATEAATPARPGVTP